MESTLSTVMSPPFLVLPPTSRFGRAVVAHGEFGLVAVVVREGMMIQDPETGAWEDGLGSLLDPATVVRETVADLADAARAPPGRIGCVVWLPQAIGAGPPTVGLCASPSPYDLARAVEAVMETRLHGAMEPMAPWIGAYAAAALGPKGAMEPRLRKVVSVIENVVAEVVGEGEMSFFGEPLFAEDMADPRYMLPALLTAAFEDWAVVVRGRLQGGRSRGFSVSLEPDPNALLGYRVERLGHSSPFILLAPLANTIRRCATRDGFVVDDLAEQFGRYLDKHGLDATIVEEVSLRVLASGEGDR